MPKNTRSRRVTTKEPSPAAYYLAEKAELDGVLQSAWLTMIGYKITPIRVGILFTELAGRPSAHEVKIGVELPPGITHPNEYVGLFKMVCFSDETAQQLLERRLYTPIQPDVFNPPGACPRQKTA